MPLVLYSGISDDMLGRMSRVIHGPWRSSTPNRGRAVTVIQTHRRRIHPSKRRWQSSRVERPPNMSLCDGASCGALCRNSLWSRVSLLPCNRHQSQNERSPHPCRRLSPSRPSNGSNMVVDQHSRLFAGSRTGIQGGCGSFRCQDPGKCRLAQCAPEPARAPPGLTGGGSEAEMPTVARAALPPRCSLQLTSQIPQL